MGVGAGGRRPADTALKLLRGERPQRINNDKPVPLTTEPDRPRFADPECEQVWDWVTGHLREMKTLAASDRDLLAAYCRLVVAQRRADEHLARHGYFQLDLDKGVTKENPALAALKDTTLRLERLAAHFGLSPYARSSIKVGGKGADDDDGKSPDRFLTA